jgi:signal transduction histidine kinase
MGPSRNGASREARTGLRRRWFGLPPRIALGFGAALLSLGVAAAASSFALGLRAESADRVTRAATIQLAVEELESSLLVGHASLDAYLGTRGAEHRRRHLRAAEKIGFALAGLARLVAEDRGALELIDRIAPAIEAVVDEHARALALAGSGDFEGALALRRASLAAGALERAKDEIDAFEAREAAEVIEAQLRRERTLALSTAVFIATDLLLLALIVLAARLVRDEIGAREDIEAARERAHTIEQRIIAVVSHDLRNPLAAILAGAWALARGGLPPEHAHLARRIAGAGRRMERLIRDLLDWSRVHSGTEIPISACDADLHDVCKRIHEEFDGGNGRLRLEREGDTRAVFDPDRMEQVVANLVGNALKYSPADAPVRVLVAGDLDEVRVEVRDEGPGIPVAAREELFQPFRRGRDTDPADGGAGLGLFIVRTLSEAQGARVELHSGPGRGTIFVVRLRRPAAAPGLGARTA